MQVFTTFDAWHILQKGWNRYMFATVFPHFNAQQAFGTCRLETVEALRV